LKASSLIQILIILALFFTSCSKENLVGINSHNSLQGTVTLKIDKAAIPAEVNQITTFLSRQGYDTLSSSISSNGDSLNVFTFQNVPIGKWHLNVNAANSDGEVIYSGQSDITIIEDEIIDVYLILTPINNGKGNIIINIDWGNNQKWIDFSGNPLFTVKNNPTPPYFGCTYSSPGKWSL
jgi:hypothetical protein